MSIADRAFGLLKQVLVLKETMHELRSDLEGLGSGLARLSESHASLSERVSRIEGFIDGAAAASDALAKRLPRS